MVHCTKEQINCFGVRSDLILGGNDVTSPTTQMSELQECLWTRRDMIYRKGIHYCDANREKFVIVHEDGETTNDSHPKEIEFVAQFTTQCSYWKARIQKLRYHKLWKKLGLP
jgi:hypothetical protein